MSYWRCLLKVKHTTTNLRCSTECRCCATIFDDFLTQTEVRQHYVTLQRNQHSLHHWGLPIKWSCKGPFKYYVTLYSWQFDPPPPSLPAGHRSSRDFRRHGSPSAVLLHSTRAIRISSRTSPIQDSSVFLTSSFLLLFLPLHFLNILLLLLSGRNTGIFSLGWISINMVRPFLFSRVLLLGWSTFNWQVSEAYNRVEKCNTPRNANNVEPYTLVHHNVFSRKFDTLPTPSNCFM